MNIADIFAEARDLADATITSCTNATLLRRVNLAAEDLTAQIIGADGFWQFDDTNFTDLPIGVTTMVDGQHDYAFTAAHLNVLRMEILLADGITWQKIYPIDISQIHGAVEQYKNVSGIPIKYDKQGGSVFLYPAPKAGSVTLIGGLKIYFQRTSYQFTSGDLATGTIQPGFASPFHLLLSYKAILPYAQKYKKDRVPMIMSYIQANEVKMLTFYSKRVKDEKQKITTKRVSGR